MTRSQPCLPQAISGKENFCRHMPPRCCPILLKMSPRQGIARLGGSLLAGMFLLLQAMATSCPAAENAALSAGDRQVAAFFQELEEAFRNKHAPDIMAKLHKTFSYLMTYCTDDSCSVVENTLETYRSSVGSFFMSDPEVQKFAITLEHIARQGENIVVVAHIQSAVLLHGILNTCETSSNYTLLEEKGQLLIRNVRGDASCVNTRIDGDQP